MLLIATHYVGDYEVEFDAEGNKRELHYISGGDGIFAIYVKEDEVWKMYYVHKDHLGSPYCLTDKFGQIPVFNGKEQCFSFDPWGRRRNATDWSYNSVPTKDERLFDRGFTGHEHLDLFGLINMNGRTYDPWLGRMLQPDNYVQDGGYSQNYNRYSYAYNNPLKYNDPSGEFIQYVIGAAIGGVVGYVSGRSAGLRGGELAMYTLTSAGIGAVSGGIGAGAGSAVNAGGSAFVGGMISGAAGGAAGGFIGGVGMTAMNNTFLETSQNVVIGGLKGAAIGAAVGGITGGIRGGLYNAKEGLGFFNGAIKLSDEDIGYFDLLASNDGAAGTIPPSPGQIPFDSKIGRKVVHMLKWTSYANKYNHGEMDLKDAFSNIRLLPGKELYGSNLSISSPRIGVNVSLGGNEFKVRYYLSIFKSSLTDKLYSNIYVGYGSEYYQGDWTMVTNKYHEGGCFTVATKHKYMPKLFEYLFHRKY